MNDNDYKGRGSLGYLPVLAAIIAALVLAFAVACSEESADKVESDPVAFESGEECHLCGMIITESPGPKGQAVGHSDGKVLKFCSTRDMFGWWLQPENRRLQASLYVHDMSNTDWRQPDDRHLVDARTAFYVIGTDLQGAMGATLASFADRAEAEKLASSKGGRVFGFDEITLETLSSMTIVPG